MFKAPYLTADRVVVLGFSLVSEVGNKLPTAPRKVGRWTCRFHLPLVPLAYWPCLLHTNDDTKSSSLIIANSIES